ncbi:MAG: tRNA (adenosine(37)-N6)-threonylcarbamoyltransferase complex dimerization subunit type 1 TsaB [Candidatus Eremiobacteraeota bacterium]|nr:tRNA (adenosine(37)-N6)-threonylcarbamoyltransferase complex dimerization subunit type 1 TsaB [Candidatus Eremiobacteraeota bacterium]
MKILAIDGAFGAFTCAVSINGTVIAHERVSSGATLERGLESVNHALLTAQTTGRDLDRIAVCTGPGSFTGSRIAISFAKSLAFAWRKPLIAIGAFDLLERGVSDIPRAAIVCAREGVVSTRLTTAASTATRSGPASSVCEWMSACSPDERLTTIDAPKDVLAALGERGKLVHNLPPPAPALALAELAQTREPVRSLHEVRPDYGDIPPARAPAAQ